MFTKTAASILKGISGFATKQGIPGAGRMAGMEKLAPFIGSGITGSVAAGVGAGLYNAVSDNNISIGSAMKMGFMGGAALKYGRGFTKASLPSGGWNKAMKWAGGMEKKASSFLNKKLPSGGALGMSRGALAKYGGMGAPGAIAGAGLGAGYGMFSDRESMMSGAFKGAIGGALLSAGKRQFTGKFGSMTKSAGGSVNSNMYRTGFHSMGVRT